MKSLYTWKSKLDPSEGNVAESKLIYFTISSPPFRLYTSFYLFPFDKFYQVFSFSTCLGWNLLIHNQPVDISLSYNVFCIPTSSTYLFSLLKCPGNTAFPPSLQTVHCSKTYFMNAKKDTLKHVCRFSSVPKSCPDRSPASMCNVSAPSRDSLGEYLITTSLGWCACDRVVVIWLPAAPASPWCFLVASEQTARPLGAWRWTNN